MNDEKLTVPMNVISREEFESDNYRNGYRNGYSAGVAATFNPSLRWVNIKDKLPEKNIQVLCYGEEPSSIHDNGLPYKTGIYDGRNWISDHFCESSYIKVTHWMFFPSPPGEKYER